MAPEIRLALGRFKPQQGLIRSLMLCSRCAAFRAEKPLCHNETFSLDELSIKTEHERGFFPGIRRKGARSGGQGAADVGERVGTDSHASLTNISGLAQHFLTFVYV